jgi:anaerobic selenocysteine-containing dehydrogenase
MQSDNSKPLNLAKALGIKSGDVVSFVGGGGKTTSMYHIASEPGRNQA